MKHLERALTGGNQFWKYILIFLISFFGGGAIGSLPLIIIIAMKAMNRGDISIISNLGDVSNLGALGISPNLTFFLMLLPFLVSIAILLVLIKLLHNRSYKEVINGTQKVRWNRFFFGFASWGALMAFYYVADYVINPSNFVLQFDLYSFIPLVAISLLMLPVQTSFEELAMRGYLAQGIGALTKSRWLALLIPSVFFGLLHYGNPEVKEYGFLIMMPQYILIGLVFGFVSILDDGIELAMGAHAVNNIFLSLFITHSSSALQTAAVFCQQEINPYKELIALVLMSVIFIGFLYKKYGWNFSVLNKKIEKE